MKKLIVILMCGVVILGISNQSLCAEMVTVAPTDDSYVDYGNTGTNYGTSPTLNVVSWNTAFFDVKKSYLQFDLGNIPDSATITSATLNLYSVPGSPPFAPYPKAVFAHHLGDSWDESTLTFYNRPFMMSETTSNWTLAVTDTWNSWDITAWAQSDNRADDDLLTIGLAENGTYGQTGVYFYFASKEYPDVNLRPSLVMEVIPEPTTLLLLALGGLGLVVRRRRGR